MKLDFEKVEKVVKVLSNYKKVVADMQKEGIAEELRNLEEDEKRTLSDEKDEAMRERMLAVITEEVNGLKNVLNNKDYWEQGYWTYFLAGELLGSIDEYLGTKDYINKMIGVLKLYWMIKEDRKIECRWFSVEDELLLTIIEKFIEARYIQCRNNDVEKVVSSYEKMSKRVYSKKECKVAARTIYMALTCRQFPKGRNIKTIEAAIVWDILLCLNYVKKETGMDNNDKKDKLKSWFDTKEIDGKNQWKHP